MIIKLLGSYDSVKSLPVDDRPEYAFIGRSNVGKSSLINAVAGSVIARTSKTPGRTRLLNLFAFDDNVLIMDLPGYGYAKVSRTETDRWLTRLEEYLETRRQLKRLFILVDSRIEIKQSDLELMRFCDIKGISYQVVLTKKDKRTKDKDQTKISADNHPAMIEQVIETSAEKKIGIIDIRQIIGIK